jgi:hypothetical protein
MSSEKLKTLFHPEGFTAQFRQSCRSQCHHLFQRGAMMSHVQICRHFTSNKLSTRRRYGNPGGQPLISDQFVDLITVHYITNYMREIEIPTHLDSVLPTRVDSEFGGSQMHANSEPLYDPSSRHLVAVLPQTPGDNPYYYMPRAFSLRGTDTWVERYNRRGMI